MMSDRTPAVRVDDYFHMSLSTVLSTWGLSEEELRRELSSGRLAVHGVPTADGGYDGLRCYLPSLLRWIARKRLMPPRVRAKIHQAGGLERLDQFRREQIDLCYINFVNNTVTLPDGSVMHDITLEPEPRH